MVTTAKEVINIAKLQLGLHDRDLYLLNSYMLGFIADMALYLGGATQVTKEVQVAVQRGVSVPLPKDFSEEVGVGVNINGFVKGLALNPSLVGIQPQGINFATVPLANNWWYFGSGSWTGGRWMAGDSGDYSIDRKKKSILISPFYPYKNIVLHYISNCMPASDEFCIPIRWYNSALLYLKRQYSVDRKDPIWQVYDRDYKGEVNTAKIGQVNLTDLIERWEFNSGWQT